MAAGTITRRRESVFGNQRAEMANVTFAQVGDTYTASSMKVINSWHVESAGVNAIGATIAGNVVTCTGAAGAANLLVIGT